MTLTIDLSRGVLVDDDSDARAAAIVAGTLCLMSCYVQYPAPIYADRIVGNLHRIARHGDLSPELRTICRRLAARWDVIRRDACLRTAGGGRAIDGRPLH